MTSAIIVSDSAWNESSGARVRWTGSPEDKGSEDDRHQDTRQGDAKGQTVPTVQGVDGGTPRGQERGGAARGHGPEYGHREHR